MFNLLITYFTLKWSQSHQWFWGTVGYFVNRNSDQNSSRFYCHLLFSFLEEFWFYLICWQIQFIPSAKADDSVIFTGPFKDSDRKTSKLFLTLIGMRGDTFISLSFLNQILSADFLSKLSKHLEVKIEINRVILICFIKVAPILL